MNHEMFTKCSNELNEKKLLKIRFAIHRTNKFMRKLFIKRLKIDLDKIELNLIHNLNSTILRFYNEHIFRRPL